MRCLRPSLVIVCLLLAGSLAAQEADQSLRLALDLDGDGRPETIEVQTPETPQEAEGAEGPAPLLLVSQGGRILYQRVLEYCLFDQFHSLDLKSADGGALLCWTCSSGANYQFSECLFRLDGRFVHHSLPGFLNNSPDSSADLNGDGREDLRLAACYSVGSCFEGRENELFLDFDGRAFSPLIPGGFKAAHLVDLRGQGLVVVGLRAGALFDAVEFWGASGGRMVLLRSVMQPARRSAVTDDQGWDEYLASPVLGQSLRNPGTMRVEYAGLAFQVTAQEASLEGGLAQRLALPLTTLGATLARLFPGLNRLLTIPDQREPSCSN